jgi:hypothetical protein
LRVCASDAEPAARSRRRVAPKPNGRALALLLPPLPSALLILALLLVALLLLLLLPPRPSGLLLPPLPFASHAKSSGVALFSLWRP